METGTLLIGIILLLILLIPFIYAIRHQQNKHKKEKAQFTVLTSSQHLKISTPEVINDLILGLDSAQGKLAISHIHKLENELRVINLKSFNTYSVLFQTSEYVKLTLSNYSPVTGR